jgi:hypothetical protein
MIAQEFAPCPAPTDIANRNAMTRRDSDFDTSKALRSTAVVAALAASVSACSGIDAGVDYPSDLGNYETHLVTPENGSDPSVGFNEFKFKPELCQGIDTHTATQVLGQDDLTRYLEKVGVKIVPKKARTNLYWYDFPTSGKEFVRLRLAILESSVAAAEDLHTSLKEHGPGWWGLRRGNLAVLAPKTDLDEAVGFAVKHKLVCWGMFTTVGVDDAYVVPGPYMEL